ncbi:MAG: DEAD/DEAH box helicase, partial [Phycisphaerae bacterium]|nr:DEAD/DEAH box helicase [Phycisphaerae bacterium]
TALLHGDRSQRQRQMALDEFSRGEARVLVATDVAARGLHVPVVRTVINYDVPLMPEEYVHRIGRAGHGGGFAEAITLLCPADADRWTRVLRAARMEITPELPPTHSAYQRGRMGVAPDTERPTVTVASAKKVALRKAKEAEREKEREQPSLATLIRRSGRPGAKRAGSAAGKKTGKKTTRRGTQRRRPLGKGQKPGGGVKRSGPSQSSP